MRVATCIPLLLCSLHASAQYGPPPDPYFWGNVNVPYPPGCATLPARQFDLYGENVVRFFSGSLWLEVAQRVRTGGNFRNLGLVDLNMYRVGCAEPGRSVILAEFSLPEDWPDPRNAQLVLPDVGGSGAWDYVPFEFKAEPNGWGRSIEQPLVTVETFGDYTGGWDDARRFTWRYVLDVGPVGLSWGNLADYYNSRIYLTLFQYHPYDYFGIEVPATHELLDPNPSLPLNGRLGGIWVEPGAADQGMILSFANPVPSAGASAEEPENAPLAVFATWFTYDGNGEALWLAGSAQFPQGASEVTLPVVQVGQGEFLGDGETNRKVVGSLRLSSTHCNAMVVDYDLDGLDMGAGEMQLQRLEALEIAGYPCRDYAARQSSLATTPAH